MNSLGIGIDDLERTLEANNVEPGSMLVRDGYYEYNIRIASFLRTPEDVENIYLNKGGRIMQLKELCKVSLVTQHETGRSLAGGKRAVTFAIIKQSEENMDNLKAELQRTTERFAALYPDIEFSITRNQTERWIIPFRICSRILPWVSCLSLSWRCSLSAMCVRR